MQCILSQKMIVTVPHPGVFWAYCFFEVKDWIVVAEGPKIFDFQ